MSNLWFVPLAIIILIQFAGLYLTITATKSWPIEEQKQILSQLKKATDGSTIVKWLKYAVTISLITIFLGQVVHITSPQIRFGLFFVALAALVNALSFQRNQFFRSNFGHLPQTKFVSGNSLNALASVLLALWVISLFGV